MKISATIVTLNEERNIVRAIRSLAGVDEVLVVDSGSLDNTVALAVEEGARVMHNPWPGYAAQKNFAAREALNEWILSIDADEELTPELRAEIAALDSDAAAGYSMPRLARYLGRWIRHSGWYPDRKVRLYRRDRGRWIGDHVHESVLVNGRVVALRGDLLHYTCDSLSAHLQTIDRYTTLAARDAGSRGMVHLMLNPPWTFLRGYIVQRGFLDGWQGFALAWMAALYTFLKYAKARDANSSSR